MCVLGLLLLLRVKMLYARIYWLGEKDEPRGPKNFVGKAARALPLLLLSTPLWPLCKKGAHTDLLPERCAGVSENVAFLFNPRTQWEEWCGIHTLLFFCCSCCPYSTCPITRISITFFYCPIFLNFHGCAEMMSLVNCDDDVAFALRPGYFFFLFAK